MDGFEVKETHKYSVVILTGLWCALPSTLGGKSKISKNLIISNGYWSKVKDTQFELKIHFASNAELHIKYLIFMCVVYVGFSGAILFQLLHKYLV